METSRDAAHRSAAGLATASAEGRDLSGTNLGGYRLLRRLGSGGMADVYLAEQVSLGRHVAVKVLRPETLRYSGAVERFEQEARAAAALVHGNIVQIHEVARVDGIHFLVEEYVGGPSLKAWLEARGPLDPRQALAVLAQVGSALERAANQGIVHRDIKPENLLVTPAGEVKVADFGLARVLGEDLELTQAGTTLGTPLYMSPEQGEGKAVDARSDLYSLGATLYHLLTGRPPFTGPTGVSVVMAHIREPLVPMATLRPDLPPPLCGIVERLLAKDPADRQATPRELLRDVAEVEATSSPQALHEPAPLRWQGNSVDDAAGFGSRPGLPGWSASGSPGARGTSQRSDVRAATQHLQAVLVEAEESRQRVRRRWLFTALAAAVAAALGFRVGRSRPRTFKIP
jgi:serine/threonine protein kinase